MIILGIETSCDETALSLIESDCKTLEDASFAVLSDYTLSQAKLHEQYGGVFPSMAKREHSRNLIPLFRKIMEESKLENYKLQTTNYKLDALNSILEREPDLLKQFLEFIPTIEKPPIDLIAVTSGPGLEIALWAGINFARALGNIWDIPIMPINHMEGHVFSALISREENSSLLNVPISFRKSRILDPLKRIGATRYTLHAPTFPAMALLISGGHTELVLMKDWFVYEVVGQTKDDAAGEAFDKIARFLSLPYPGGAKLSALAKEAREKNINSPFKLPRPMIHDPSLDFSFSGLKTAALYGIKKLNDLSESIKLGIARETEDAISEVVTQKTSRAIEKYDAKSLIVAGGVAANDNIRNSLENLAHTRSMKFFLPEKEQTGDNALMIATAGFIRSVSGEKTNPPLKALGSLSL